ncbi:MAG: protoheme IX farnesyltransferase [Actinobacteria bacterium]|nr:protoheme IX farnesyltransferase [Actinomycetota bacterium]
MTRFQKLTVATAATTIVLFAVGGLVRGSGSGLGCSSWPTCQPGRLFPSGTMHSLIEFSHRFLVFVVSVLAAATAVAALRSFRSVPQILAPALGSIPLVIGQAVLGGIVVRTDLNPTWVTAHFAVALALVADVVYLAASSFLQEAPGVRASEHGVDPAFARLTLATTVVTGALLLVGTYVRARNAGLAFLDWPLMDGKLVPALGGAATAMFLHRVLAALAFVLALYVAIRARAMANRSKELTTLSTITIALFVVQILVGAANVITRLRPAAVVAHVAFSVLIWGTLVTLATVARGPAARAVAPGPEPAGGGRGNLRDTVTAYVALTKPGIIGLLLITTVPAMVLATRGLPSPWLILATLAGGTIAAGSANAINMYLDRDIDEVMRRTRSRPLPAHMVTEEQTLAFGFALGAFSFFFLSITVNVLAATLALSAIAFYVFVYTMWLKRTTAQNIVIGGAAGAAPALVGWAAVTGSVGLPALVLFAIVFAWTPPHFWALAMRFQGDYASAGVPMLPVVKGEEETRRQIFLYSLVLFGTTLLLAPVGHMGIVYLVTAIVLGGAFVRRALVLWRRGTPELAWGLFRYSIWYLAALFGAVAVDALLPAGSFRF